MSGYDASAEGRRSPWKVPHTTPADCLDDLFDELEQALAEEPEKVEMYPYWGTRPPLPSRRGRPSVGGLLLATLAAASIAGVTFWVTRPAAAVFSRQAFSLAIGTMTPPLGKGRQENPPLVLSGFESHSPAPAPQPAEDLPATAPPPLPKTATNPAPPALQPSPKPAPLRRRATPVPAPSAAAAVRVASPPVPMSLQPAPPMKLVGLIHDPGAPKALILMDNVVRQVAVGQVVKADWRVTSIGPQGVTISNGVQRVTLQLGIPQPL